MQRFYELGLWTKEMIRQAVEKGLITEEDYIDIVGLEETV